MEQKYLPRTQEQMLELHLAGDRMQKAFSVIVLAINSSQLYLVTSSETPSAAWTALRNHYERDTLANKLLLKKQYFRAEMKDGTSVERHLKQMKELTARLAAIGAPIAEEDVVTLLGSLPKSYSGPPSLLLLKLERTSSRWTICSKHCRTKSR